MKLVQILNNNEIGKVIRKSILILIQNIKNVEFERKMSYFFLVFDGFSG